MKATFIIALAFATSALTLGLQQCADTQQNQLEEKIYKEAFDKRMKQINDSLSNTSHHGLCIM